jgi:hypothetical protein
MIHDQAFSCPCCGAPGQCTSGVAEYSCMCRFSRALPPQAPMVPFLPPPIYPGTPLGPVVPGTPITPLPTWTATSGQIDVPAKLA